MKFNLSRDIVFFDIEATGLNVVRDRIIQIGLVKYMKDSDEPRELELLINPGPVLISEEAYAVHGISSEMLANKPLFHQVAQQIWDFIGDADLAGYNSDRFDIPMLMEEFSRAGFEFNLDNRSTIDVQKIFYKMEPRTLTAAYKLYCGKTMENAHDALIDVKATIEVLQGQIRRYENVDYVDGDGFTHPAPIKNDIDAIAKFTNDSRIVDVTMRLKYNQKGQIVFNFGKYNGQVVAEVLSRDKQYYNWILEKDFSAQVKQIVKRLVKENENPSRT
ncbi:MAG: 3'-5' exonuclease [Saprospiraceae bacterium]|nr:3'-5' exonuclease [Bacteroidia bacterium]MBT8228793.1 3'-5' exonuclease [Bacteroidia bacterium]NNF22729.1 3'-5' exonuclease [Saprospiraceae bacterium]NNK89087.1 3'-5' exonuclease [Saprospiraceae bacterium]